MGVHREGDGSGTCLIIAVDASAVPREDPAPAAMGSLGSKGMQEGSEVKLLLGEEPLGLFPPWGTARGVPIGLGLSE